MFETLRESARSHILEELEDYEGYGCDFHNMAFDEGYYECYTDRAIEQLEEMGVFDCIEYVKNYEQDNFGIVDTDFSNPCDILNMMWYIIGEEEICEMFDGCDLWDELWNYEITEEDAEKLIAWYKEQEA